MTMVLVTWQPGGLERSDHGRGGRPLEAHDDLARRPDARIAAGIAAPPRWRLQTG
ncbi:MAG: hypothetical protein U1F67_03710 [Rubrivivax sp.]